MKKSTQVAVDAAKEYGAKYDAACKELFQNREIIAPILKELVPEYKDCTMAEVISCIESGSIQSDPVDDVSVIAGNNETELSSMSDKLIRYDTRFRALNPKLSNESIRFYLHIDIEVQNDYRPASPNYPVIKRAIYYAAREISSQLGILTKETNYSALQKCYSIWICNERIPKKLQNTVTSYSLRRSDIIGKTSESEADYDLMQVIIIRRGNNEGKEEIFDYLTGIFTSNIQTISKYIDVENNTKAKEGTAEMEGMGVSIFKRGMQQGLAEGILQGRSEGLVTGRKEEKYANAKALLKSGIAPEIISAALDLPLPEVLKLSS